MNKTYIKGEKLDDKEHLLYDEDEKIISYITDYTVMSRVPANKEQERALMMFCMQFLFWKPDDCIEYIEKLKTQEAE